ncbi:MAG: PAS domain-containing protein [Desulfomonile tiedjei]|uniref:PAS domain-containing protein n=1 Tax=Desulfomonile tiedjei TaxID=2358 RepID=A0A9D6Z802_9BACT|nr:PAS domain-containing protein [Desulfomonile tiedjei]
MALETFAVLDNATDDYAQQLRSQNEPTQTIDLQGLLLPEVSSSGVFDLRSIGTTALGKLLEALPIPIMLIDKWFFVAFANRAFCQISENYKEIQGERFVDMLPSPDDADRARLLTEKTMGLLERVFAERKQQQAEAILKIAEKKIWARLHLRSIRVNADRHIMVIIEDVTAERSQARIGRRDEERLRQALENMKSRIRKQDEELSRTRQRLESEVREHDKTREALKQCLARELT